MLDSGARRGWLAIDPKGLDGERGFGFAAPTWPTRPRLPVAAEPGRFARRLAVVAGAAGLERGRPLRWVLAWATLSAAWSIEDGAPPAAELDR